MNRGVFRLTLVAWFCSASSTNPAGTGPGGWQAHNSRRSVHMETMEDHAKPKRAKKPPRAASAGVTACCEWPTFWSRLTNVWTNAPEPSLAGKRSHSALSKTPPSRATAVGALSADAQGRWEDSDTSSVGPWKDSVGEGIRPRHFGQRTGTLLGR